jgi:hypothetical protein
VMIERRMIRSGDKTKEDRRSEDTSVSSVMVMWTNIRMVDMINES